MTTKYIVQAHENGKWKAIYRGDDLAKVQSTYHEACGYVGEDNVRALKSVGTKEDGTTRWAAIVVPNKKTRQGIYNALVEGLYTFWARKGHDISRKEVRYVWMPFVLVLTVVLPLFLVIALMLEPGGSTTESLPVSEMTIDQYVQYCKPMPSAEFEAKCAGDQVVFTGYIRNVVTADHVEADIPFAKSGIQGFDLLLDDDYAWPDDWKSYRQRPIQFVGTLKNNDYTDHDIDNVQILSIGSIEDAHQHIQALALAAKEAAAQKAGFTSVADYDRAQQAKARCHKDWSQCTSQEQLVNEFDNDYGRGLGDARTACLISAQAHAKYGDPDFPLVSFGTYLTNERSFETGKITLIEPRAKFQNGFGAWKVSEVTCEYDLKAHKVTSLWIN